MFGEDSSGGVMFWAREYGDDPMTNSVANRRFNADEILKEADRFYNYYVDTLKWVDKEKIDRKGEKIRYKGLEKGRTVAVAGGTSLLVAGKQVVVGAPGAIHVVDLTAGKVMWTAEVDGAPHGLAVADGRLFVSTDRGTLHCFAAPVADPPVTHEPKLDAKPYGDNTEAAAAAAAT